MAWLFRIDPVVVLDESDILRRQVRDAAALVVLRERLAATEGVG